MLDFDSKRKTQTPFCYSITDQCGLQYEYTYTYSIHINNWSNES